MVNGNQGSWRQKESEWRQRVADSTGHRLAAEGFEFARQ
ncbi:UNVERIFIED_ORG: hypothetical protein J2791_002911 [Burkholderia contaminans]|nr:hypothetical protein [Burkholderia contaminans]